MAEGGIEHNETLDSTDVWADEQTAMHEIQEFNKPVYFSKMIDGARVFLMGAGHSDSAPLDYVYYLADELKDSGITHFALELAQGKQPLFDRINQGDVVSDDELNIAFRGESNQETELNQWTITGPAVARSLAKQGIKLIAVDADLNLPLAPKADDYDPDDLESLKRHQVALAKYFQEFQEALEKFSSNTENREETLLNNFQTLIKDPANKIAGLFGFAHVHRNFKVGLADKRPSLATRLADRGIPLRTALFLGGSGLVRDTEAERFNGLVRKSGLVSEEFVLDMGKYNNPTNKSVPYGPRNSDFIVHMRQPVRK